MLTNIKVRKSLLIALAGLLFSAGSAFAQTGGDTEAYELDEVVVEGRYDGSAAAGYKVDTARNMGPWGDRKLLDTPYSMFVISEQLIENTQARNLGDLFKLNPLSMYSGDGYDVNNLSFTYTRGFWGNRNYINGISFENTGLFVENVENMQVLSGFSGFMYGVGNVGGMTSYTTKRPTSDYMARMTVGDYGGGQYYGHADLGGPIIEDKLNFRFNALYQDGHTAVKDQDLMRAMVSGALDWHVTDDFVLRFDGSYSRYELDGRQLIFNLNSNTATGIPRTVDGSKIWGPDDTFNHYETYMGGLSGELKFLDMFTFRAGYAHKDNTRKTIYTGTATVLANLQDYQFQFWGNKSRTISDGGYAYLDAEFDTLGIGHKLTVGANGYISEDKVGVYDGNRTNLRQAGDPWYTYSFKGGNNYAGVPKNWSVNGNMRKSAENYNYSFIIGDEIKLTEQWSVLGGLNFVTLHTQNYNAVNGVKGSKYDKSAVTPTISLMFKPWSNVTTYVSYMEALEEGAIVGSGYINEGEVMKPMRSYQYEAGIKAEVAENMLLTAAVFHIDRSNYYDKFNAAGTEKTRTQDGRQVHNGLELTFQGRLFEDLTILGGFAYLDAEVKKTNDSKLKGKSPTGVPEYMAKIYAEYDVPFAEGLTLTGGVYYMGSKYANTYNTNKYKAYTTADLGARFTTDIIWGVETTFRLNVTNITNERYWSSHALAGQSPANPRTLVFSATAGF